jgi:light-regulated signal transduction histidine kinase (bacteriophytochrome)
VEPKWFRESEAPIISITGAVRDGRAEVAIKDNGIGFEPEYRDRIFEVFQRLHGRRTYEALESDDAARIAQLKIRSPR